MIEKKVRFSGAIERCDYYKRILSDYVAMDIPENKKRCENKENLKLHAMSAKVKSQHIELRKTCCVILRFIKEIYGMEADFFRFFKVYNGIVGQTNLLVGLVSKLTYVPIPGEHYTEAILYNIKKMEEREKYLHMVIEDYILMTPLGEYCKTLPKGVSIFDDIWNNIEDESLDYDNEQISIYMNSVLNAIDISSISEARKEYLRRLEIKMKKLEEEKAAAKIETLKKKRVVADGFATKFSNDLHKRYNYVKTMAEGTRNAIYRNCEGIKNPKIYVLVNVVSANQAGKTPPVRFLGEDGKITSAITKAKVFSNDDETPSDIVNLYESYKYGFAELMLG